MGISFAPKVGEILECNYGDYRRAAEGQILTNDFGAHIPPEMVKNRLVVVINGKINGNACIVVPLSTTKDSGKLGRGFHVELAKDLIEDLPYFQQQIRWAKADLVQQVSKSRLFRPRSKRGYLNQVLPREVVADIQRAIIKSINGSALLMPSVEIAIAPAAQNA